MRFLRIICSLAVFCGITASAVADPSDYRTGILDPVSFASNYTVYTIQSNSFSVIFTPCATAELPGGLTADGCFAGINDSGSTWNGLDINFPNNRVLGSQPVSCAPAASDNVFSIAACTLSPDKTAYFLDFSNGIIPSYPNTPGDQFFITEIGVDPLLFPEGTATATTITATPEPASLSLLLTGVCVIGFLLYRTGQRPALLG